MIWGQRYIPLLLRDCVYLLAVVGNTEWLGSQLVLMPDGESAIVVAAPHAKAITLSIEGDQRGADKIERAVGHHLQDIQLRLFDAVAVSLPWGWWLCSAKRAGDPG